MFKWQNKIYSFKTPWLASGGFLVDLDYGKN